LLREFFGDVDANSEIDALRKRIKAARELIKWADRLGESAMYLNIGNFALTKERVNYLERQILELEHEVDLLKE
jgi:predicted  nucleic acid-binding Zn-ribbon protein